MFTCCYTTLKLQAPASNRELQTKCVKIYRFEEKAQHRFTFILSLNGRRKTNNVETFVSTSEDDRLGKANLNSCSGNSKMLLTEKDLEGGQNLWTFKQTLEKTSKINQVQKFLYKIQDKSLQSLTRAPSVESNGQMLDYSLG